MKKILSMLVVICLFALGTQVVFANSDKATVQEGADLSAVHRMAIAMPLYVQIKNSPTKDAVKQVIYDASKVSHLDILSYDMLAASIKKDTSADILTLDRRAAAKTYRENVAKYADAYVVVTVANDSRTVFFFDVYQAGTDKLLYTYEIVANGSEKDTVEVYKGFADQFYKNFERAQQEQSKGK